MKKKEKNMDKEIVICSAVKVEDKIWRGHRHNHALQAMRDELSQKITDKELRSINEDQGFITSKNRFVSREEALELQKAAGIKSADKNGYRFNILFSEDVY
jgi:hypothetical protein